MGAVVEGGEQPSCSARVGAEQVAGLLEMQCCAETTWKGATAPSLLLLLLLHDLCECSRQQFKLRIRYCQGVFSLFSLTKMLCSAQLPMANR